MASGAVQAQDVDLSMLGDGGFAVDGAAVSDFSGTSVSGAGDVNGDGLADLIVGAAFADPGGQERAGSSYVVFGKADSTGIDLANLGNGGFVLNGIATFDYAGGSVSGAGDVNGDGLADLVIGRTSSRASASGSGYVVFGKADSAPVDLGNLGSGGFVLDGTNADDFVGFSVSGAGDVNGDGLADIIVGDSSAAPGGLSEAGSSYVVFGKADSMAVDLANLDGSGFVLNGSSSIGRSGVSVSGMGDVNGDGLADLLVGSTGTSPLGDPQAGTTFVVFGKSDSEQVDLGDLGSGGFVLAGAAPVDRAGRNVSGVGDVNGDGLADLIVGAPYADPGGNYEAGSSYVVFGKADTVGIELGNLGDRGFVLEGVAEGDYSGWSVAGAGDVNGDGLADLMVGARGADPGGRSFAGSSYVVFGKADSAAVDLANLGSAGFRLDGGAQSDSSGQSLSGAGDVNGDGLADLIVGAPGSDPTDRADAGISYVVLSRETPALSASVSSRSVNGDAPRVAVGITGDGSNDSTPDARLWIDFADGVDPTALASQETVTLNRRQGQFGAAAASVNWRIETTRTDWTSAEITFRYLDGELLNATEANLEIVYAPAPNGPFTTLPSIANPANNTVRASVTQLGYFFMGEGLGDVIFDDGFEAMGNP